MFRGFHDASENVSQRYFDHGVDCVDETLIARLMTSADRAYYRPMIRRGKNVEHTGKNLDI